MIDEMLNHNKAFVERGDFEPYSTSKCPDKKLAIVTCMDTRLTELLRNHPLIPNDIQIYGFVMDSVTGELHRTYS